MTDKYNCNNQLSVLREIKYYLNRFMLDHKFNAGPLQTVFSYQALCKIHDIFRRYDMTNNEFQWFFDHLKETSDSLFNTYRNDYRRPEDIMENRTDKKVCKNDR